MAALPALSSAALPSAPARVGVHGLPSLRLHKGSGQYCYCYKKQWVYLGRDAARAYALWLARFGGSTEPAPAPAALKVPALAPRAPKLPKVAAPAPAPFAFPVAATAIAPAPVAATALAPLAAVPAGRTVESLAAKLREIVAGSARPETARAFGFKLAIFADAFAGRTVESITPDDLISWRAKVAKSYKPWTANGHIVAARRLGALAVELGLVKGWPMNLLKTVPLGETKTKAWTPEQINATISKVAKEKEILARMLRLQFLTAMRPFSVPELIAGRGEWTEEGVFALERSKTERQTGERVRVCLSAAALAELEAIKKLGNAPKSGPMYRQAVQRAGGNAPHALRHSAATALSKLGVADEVIETALGHSMPRVKRTYRPANYQAAREALARLAELVPAL